MAHARQLGRTALELDERFLEVLELVLECGGRVVVSGIGKSGLVARKLAATLACTGTPAFFLHPGEAAHGDLGALTRDDLVILVSYSGETCEILWLLPHFERLGLPVVALTGTPDSTLARRATVVLEASADEETSGTHTVPTTSVLVAQALGDSLALAAMRARCISSEDVAELHPGSPSAPPSGGSAPPSSGPSQK